ncbi:MAG: glycosyltransferase family 4 protein [Nitrososphaerota archaeon]
MSPRISGVGGIAQHVRQLAIRLRKIMKIMNILRGLDVVTAVSMHAVKYYQSLGIRTIHIPNAIDLSEMPREGERVSEPQITYLGRLSKEKGVDLLIGAALRGLVIAGDGPMRPLIEYAARRGLLKFLGPLPREKALKILAGSDVAVLPSREEGLSTMILEAMALRIPIVATRVGGTVEVLEHGKDAVLVNANPDEIKQAVKHLLEDETYSRYLVENAYQKLIKHYNWDIIEQQYMKLYKKALEDRVSNV